jgi:hypothetical protein
MCSLYYMRNIDNNCNIYLCVGFVVLGYMFCIFMSYSTSYYSNSWIYGMYINMHACMYVSLFILIII